MNTVAAIEDVADTSEKIAHMPRRVVLVSDLSQGSRLDALGDLEWPKDVELDIKTVADSGSNAGLQVVADSAVAEAAEADLSRRVRVVNNSGSAREKFELAWLDDKGVTSGKPIDVYVPPGESRVVRVPVRLGTRRASCSGCRETRTASITICTSPISFAKKSPSSTSARTAATTQTVFSIISSGSLPTVPGDRFAFSPILPPKHSTLTRKIRRDS